MCVSVNALFEALPCQLLNFMKQHFEIPFQLTPFHEFHISPVIN